MKTLAILHRVVHFKSKVYNFHRIIKEFENFLLLNLNSFDCYSDAPFLVPVEHVHVKIGRNHLFEMFYSSVVVSSYVSKKSLTRLRKWLLVNHENRKKQVLFDCNFSQMFLLVNHLKLVGLPMPCKCHPPTAPRPQPRPHRTFINLRAFLATMKSCLIWQRRTEALSLSR